MKSRFCNSIIHIVGVPLRRDAVLRQATKALQGARKVLKYKKLVDIVIIEAQKFWTIPQLGIAGNAIGKSCVEIKIDFSRKDLSKIIKIELPATIYHELAHLARENSIGYGNTLLDHLVSEGIACWVEKCAFPLRKIPYIKKIKQEETLWRTAKKFLKAAKYRSSEWFFGSGRFPNWTGYRLGYLIVEGFMKRNKISVAKLVALRSNDILKGSILYEQ